KRYAWYDHLYMLVSMKFVLLRKENMSSFQQHLVLLASLLDNLQNCWVDLLKNKFGFDDAFNYKEEHDLDMLL
ncbi:(+)-pulegone reductase, partial [Quercus suber]